MFDTVQIRISNTPHDIFNYFISFDQQIQSVIRDDTLEYSSHSRS
jgi:hypothetical protein